MLNSLRREFQFFSDDYEFLGFLRYRGNFSFFPAGFQVLKVGSFSFQNL